MNKKSITLVTYSSVTRDDKGYYVNAAFGKLLDGLAEYFEKIYFMASKAPFNSSLYQNGKSIYSYRIMARNVKLVEVAPSKQRSLITKGMRVFLNMSRLYKYLRSGELAYVFLPGYSGIVSCFICLALKRPYILYFGTVWDETAEFRFRWNGTNALMFPIYKRLYGKMEKPVIKMAKLCIVAGKRLFDMVQPLNEHTFQTVPMTPFEGDLSSCKDCSDISRRVNLIFVGPVNKGKGVVYLLRAIDLVEKSGISVFLNLVGSLHQQYQRELDGLIAEFSLKEKVKFWGYISNTQALKKLYRDSDILVIPSLGEGFPRVIYEALIVGLSVVASDLYSIRKNLVNEDLVSLVPTKNPQAIADAVIKLCKNNELRMKRLEIGRKFAEKKLQGNPSKQLIELLRKHNVI